MKKTFIIIPVLLGVCSLLFYCNKENIVVNPDQASQLDTLSNDRLMNPGPDPELINIDSTDSRALRQSYNLEPIQNAWERAMYVDKTDTLYKSTSGTANFSRYLKKYGFTGVYFYSTSSILSSSSNYNSFGSFLNQLSDSGIAYKAVVSGSPSAFTSSGTVTRFNNSQTDLRRKINRSNLELEWWNGACSWNTWNSNNQQVAMGMLEDNDFYEGWYKNMGTTIDTIGAKDQVKYSNRILLHCYQNGIPTYSYANGQSTGATAGRLDIIAKGARQANKKIDLFIIISAENTAWGANNTFTGPALQQAYLSGQPNPYLYIENLAFNNIYLNMTTFQRQWINFKGFLWFTKRYCYAAVPR